MITYNNMACENRLIMQLTNLLTRDDRTSEKEIFGEHFIIWLIIKSNILPSSESRNFYFNF